MPECAIITDPATGGNVYPVWASCYFLPRHTAFGKPAPQETSRMKIPANAKLLFVGDSITDCNRNTFAGPCDNSHLGFGFVAIANALIGAAYPDRKIKVVNVGISGNTVRDLAGRWEKDVIAHQPTWLSCMIGINDVWRQFEKRHKEAVLPEEFESTLWQLISRTRPAVGGVVMMSPFFIEPDPKDPMRARMDHYGKIVHKIAAEQNAIFVDTQAAFDAVLKHTDKSALADDRVHPNQVGHAVLARAFLAGVGFQF
jgi:lysophospholipase L1-like esterase